MRDDEGLSTIRHAPERPFEAQSVAFVLTVVTGPDAGLSVVVSSVDGGAVAIGTGETATLKLTDRRVSRRHASLDVGEHALRITDRGSSNGTVVNGVSVIEADLRGGELVEVGESTIRIERAAGVAASPSAPASRFGAIIGASEAMRRIYPLCARIAASNLSVLVEGETGTGKEVLAESLHELGPRAAGPFVVFDCTAVPPTLVESELFGHEKGAFTGASSARKGVFEQAHGGTLLIDEIGDLASDLQPKLLRALERSEFRRVGGSTTVRVDVRVLSATRRDLEREVEAGRFRDDLFHRLAVGRVELPALRHRKGDVGLLARHFGAEMNVSRIDHEVLTRWETYAWPGNVRELRNAVMRWAALGDVALTSPSPAKPSAAHATDAIDGILAEQLPFGAARQRVLDLFEQRYVENVLAKHGGNVREAAVASGIGRRYFQRIKARTA